MSGKEKILVVDDTAPVLRMLSTFLRAEGYQVLEAATGAECLELVRQEQPDLTLLDVVLPDLDGREVCRRIKAEPALAGSYVILFSALETDSRSQVSGLAAGADGYISQPISRQALLKHMEAVLRLQQTEKALRERTRELNERIAEQRRVDKALAWEASVHAALAELSRAIIQSASLEDIAVLVLENAKGLTNSKFGYVGYIDAESGYLVSPTMTRDVWNTCQVFDKDIVFKEFRGLWGWVLTQRTALLTNDPAQDARACGTPEGHIPIERFLSVPALIGGELVGQVAVANSKYDYGEPDLMLVERLAALYAVAVQQKRSEKALRLALANSQQRQAEVSALLAGARAVLSHHTFEGSARAIYEACRDLVGATAGYVSLATADGAANEVVFLDSAGQECSVDPDLPMPIRGLRAEAYRSGQPVYDNNFSTSAWLVYLPAGHTTLDNVLFAPLLLEGKVIGLLGLANKPGGFSDDDANLAAAFGELAAVAFLNSRMLEALETSENRFRSVVQSAHDAIITVDHKGKIAFWNPAAEAMFGYPPAEAIGRPLTSIMPERFRKRHQRRFEGIVTTGTSSIVGKSMEMVAQAQDGREFPVELCLSLWESSEGSFFTGVVHDITERKWAEEALRRSHDELETRVAERTAALIQAERLAIAGKLAASLAHEINNPLQSAIGCLDLAQEALADGEDAQQFLQVASEALERATRVLAGLRDLQRQSKVEKREPGDLRILLEKVLLLTQKQLETHAIRVQWEAEEQLPSIPLMPNAIQQVFLNLVLNAIDAMAGGGTLQVGMRRSVRGRRPGVSVEIRDDGVGMPPASVARLFDPFYSTKTEGLGLGLFISQNIVQQHGGQIDVQSQEEEGTTFTVWLPA